MALRYFLLDRLRTTFEQHGFLPLETPSMERSTILEGVYGQEGQKLLFKVLNSGDFLAKAPKPTTSQALVPHIAQKGLRYDLTLPLARYVAHHRQTLVLPFKRFQMQAVWRAERPQRGRYREFFQCDLDIVGNQDLFYEAELLAIAYSLMASLGVRDLRLMLNHRGIFTALASEMGAPELERVLCQTLDKLEKIGPAQVRALLLAKGFLATAVAGLDWLFVLPVGSQARLALVHQKLGHHPAAAKAIETIKEVMVLVGHFDPNAASSPLIFTPTLARGLDYYSGTVFELVAQGSGLGSLGGGGRYDQLTELKEMGGVGLSLGLDRMELLLELQGLWPPQAPTTTLLLFPMEPNLMAQAIGYLVRARKAGIASELFPSGNKAALPLRYAEKKGIPWVAFLGEDEASKGAVMLKNMPQKRQSMRAFSAVLKELSTPHL